MVVVELSDDIWTMYEGIMMCYPNPFWFQSRSWNLLLRVGVMQQMCNRNKILIQAHQSPKSQRRYPIRQRHPLRDSVTLIYCFLLGERNVMNVMIVHALLCNFFLYKLFMRHVW